MSEQATPTIVSIKCPKCGQSLPAMASRCHFCGADASGVRRPREALVDMQARAARTRMKEALSWKEIAYFVVAAMWLLSAGYMLLQGFNVIPNMSTSVGGAPMAIVFGVFDLILGIGLLAQNDFAQFLVKIRCLVGIINGLLGLVMAFGLQERSGFFWGSLISNVFYAAFSAFAFWIISEFSD